MSQKQKLRERVRRRPKDLRFDELVKFLGDYGCELDDSGGSSHCHFVHKATGRVLNSVKPHPNPIKVIYIKQALEFIDELGAETQGECEDE